MPLHPAAEEFLKQMAASNAPAWSDMEPAESRQVFNSLTGLWGTGPQCAEVQDLKTNTGVVCRSYRPTAAAVLPAVLYFHGGGWVLGNIETHDALCRRLAEASQRCIISVDYRLAPEDPYPAAAEDAYDAWQFVVRNASDLGLEPEHIAVAGDSAGGNLAASVALRARDEGEAQIESQVLIYPVVEPDFESESYLAYESGYSLTRQAMMYFWEQYLGRLDGDAIESAAYAVLADKDLSNLPPSFVLTAEYDVLKSEAEKFATALKAAGNQVRQQQYDGMLHGFVHLAGVFGDGLQAVRDVGDFLKTEHSASKSPAGN